jgi:anti-anti-sigma factor
MQRYNKINFETFGDVMLWDIQGDITAFSDPYLNEAYQKANEQEAKQILLKIEKDAYINSGGIALLIQILAQTKINNQCVGITGASKHNEKIFRILGITKFARIYTSVENALELMANE